MKSYKIQPKLPRHHLRAGECLFREGDPGDFAYIIDEGEIEISTLIDGQYTVLNTLPPGSMFGELAIVDGSARSASAHAKTDALLTIVTAEQVNSRIQEADPIIRLLFTVVMRYFRSDSERFRPHKEEDELKSSSFESSKYSQKITEAIELIKLESDLRNAIEQEQLKLVYQPIINLQTSKIAGFEVLLRWQCPRRGYVSPGLFIPLAESTSLIIPLGEWIVEEAIKGLLAIKKQTNQEIFISINVAQRQIESANFLEFLQAKIQSTEIKTRQIKLEILERSLFEGENAMDMAQACRSLGFPLVIDDFGTGYANLAYLKQFQFDTIKIDKCFVEDLETNARDRSICRALIGLSHGLEMTVVAEGIETATQANILQELRCNLGQGYFFSPPVSLEKATALVRSSTDLLQK
jgi:EAL domain-containing protein (putative c-di-GMP-specific phosphodiesterase class I)